MTPGSQAMLWRDAECNWNGLRSNSIAWLYNNDKPMKRSVDPPSHVRRLESETKLARTLYHRVTVTCSYGLAYSYLIHAPRCAFSKDKHHKANLHSLGLSLPISVIGHASNMHGVNSSHLQSPNLFPRLPFHTLAGAETRVHEMTITRLTGRVPAGGQTSLTGQQIHCDYRKR